MESFRQVGDYIKKVSTKADFGLKRARVPYESVEKLREIFDAENPVDYKFNVPYTNDRVMLDLNFGPRLPSVTCCADCFCGATESYTSDSLISGNIYTVNSYVTGSTVVYLDGVRATSGSDYFETGPNQLAIGIPFSTITISYVYETGNCSEGQECVDDFPCPEFSLFSGLATVFYDRFDRPELNPGETYGGCGYWAQSILTTGVWTPELVVSPVGGIVHINSVALLGGPARVSGKTFEIVLAIDEGLSQGLGAGRITPGSRSYSLGFGFVNANTTQMELSLAGRARYIWRPLPDTNPNFFNMNEIQIAKSQTFTVGSTFMTAAKWVRMAQYPTGDLYISVWLQGEDESSGISLQLTLADNTATLPDNIVSFELISPTITHVGVDVLNLQAIRIGAGADTGDWASVVTGINAGSGYQLTWCRTVPPYAGQHPYFGSCETPHTTLSTVNADEPGYQCFVSFPVIVGDQPPAGTGVITDGIHKMATIDGRRGRPVAFRVKGFVSVSFATNIVVPVQFLEHPGSGPPGYNNTSMGGNLIGTMTMTTNDAALPFDFLINAENGLARWSVMIPNVDAIASSLPFIPGPFLFAPYHGLSVNVTMTTVEALSSIECNARDGCGDCLDLRCPEVVDNFADVLDTGVTTSNSEYARNLVSGGTVYVDQDAGSRVIIGTGTAEIQFTDEGTVEFRYGSPLSCNNSDTYHDTSIQFDFRVNTMNPVGAGGDISFWGEVGPTFSYQYWDGDCHPVGFGETLPVINGTVWHTAKIEAYENSYRAKVWQSDTPEPAAWDAEVTGTLNPVNGSLYLFANAYDDNSGFIAYFRNFEVRRI